jgi:hypothetical protein
MFAPALCAFALGCAAQPAQDRPFRSPTRDYPAPPAQTSDGEVVGVDRMAPADKLQTGPTNDGLAPGWSLDGGPHYHPAGEKHDHAHDNNQPGTAPSTSTAKPASAAKPKGEAKPTE